MPTLEVIDHSPHQPTPAEPIPTASNLVLIDNYDSFTWNVYQYFVLEGAAVTVFRNDEITLEELIAKKPTQLVVSPGPGHPTTDAGISKDAIKYFGGKIPVFGVCMGQQCIFEVFGGDVDQTGEILHGKTSPLRHDGKGVYQGIDQDIPVTRYHSLAGTHPTLPPDLEVSSWIAVGPDGGKGVIMGVRHKELLVEGVQFHPESILTKEGRTMLKNFLRMQGGTWAENERLNKQVKAVNGNHNTNGTTNGANSASSKTSILERIYDHRRAAVAAQRQIPSQRPEDLQEAYNLNLAPPQISFPERLKRSPYRLSLMAEIKRASPSKGVISLSTCAPAQARKYALAGASVISVLTEPEWFKGSIDDLRSVRQALNGMPNRPAVLRKEFIFDEYQILEARLAGADTVLLIVKMLDEPTLKRLYLYSQSLGMEPLVEVNTVEEMQVAVNLGSKVIGVNNRNLTNFEVDLETTSRLMSLVSDDTVVCALSGISGPEDVKPYQENGVGAVLVGEALMRAQDTTQFICNLLGGDAKPQQRSQANRLVKICGTRTPEAAKAAVEAGADLIGIILVTGRKRCVSQEQGQAISKAVHSTQRPGTTDRLNGSLDASLVASNYSSHSASQVLRHPHRALLVGVFQNQPLEFVLEQQRVLDLDVVQFHGTEPIEWARLVPVPVLRRFSPDEPGLGLRGYHALPLLDAGAGGSGTKVDLSQTRDILTRDSDVNVVLAGGLTPDNVQDVIASLGNLRDRIVGVDVSSGCEEDGVQSIPKIQAFLKAAKSA